MIERRMAGGVVALVALLIATAAPAADDRVVRGVHQGRAYRFYVPATPAPARPLIVALHGCGQTPDDFALGTRLDQAAARRGLRVLYPAQTAANNPALCWNWFVGSPRMPAGGEVGEILALVREVQRPYHPDGGRIVVLGLSAGGYMAVNLLCAAPDLVVGVGVAAGGPYRCAETSRGPVACMRGERLDGDEAASRCVKAGGKAPTASTAPPTAARSSKAGWCRACPTLGAAAMRAGRTRTRPAPTRRKRCFASWWMSDRAPSGRA
jgi:poly(hydroxyalkanoate) depolymerase family esterase